MPRTAIGDCVSRGDEHQSTAQAIDLYGDKLRLVPMDNSEAIIVKGDKFVVKRQG